MRCDVAGRAAVLGVLLLGGAAGAARAAGPTKAEPTRKAFDYSRPAPGDILPNPATGIGTPPQLREYVPTETPDVAGGGATAGAPGSAPTTATPAHGPAPEGASPPAPAAAAATAPPAPAPPPPQAGQPPPPPTAKPSEVRALFAAAVTRSGLGANLPFQPSREAAADPDVRDAEARLWARLATSLTEARDAWERRHPERLRDASDTVEAVLTPGSAVLVRAPARVTGAFGDQGPRSEGAGP